jgi:hypothetical protein
VRIYSLLSLMLFAQALILSALADSTDDLHAAQRLSLTQQLPACTSAEVQLLNAPGAKFDPRNGPVKLLSPIAAQQLASLWRNQTYGPDYGSRCHFPQFLVRFYSKNTLIVEESICFGCQNIRLLRSDITQLSNNIGEQGFNAKTNKAEELHNYLKDLFPTFFQNSK